MWSNVRARGATVNHYDSGIKCNPDAVHGRRYARNSVGFVGLGTVYTDRQSFGATDFRQKRKIHAVRSRIRNELRRRWTE